MTYRCTKCGRLWVVSVYTKQNVASYECPHCEWKRLHNMPIVRVAAEGRKNTEREGR